MSAKERILEYLMKFNPDWCYGRDIAEGTAVAQGAIYIHLSGLEDAGLVERRLDPAMPKFKDLPPRHQFRLKT